MCMSTTLPYSGFLRIHLLEKSKRNSLLNFRPLLFTTMMWLTLLSTNVGHSQVNTYVFSTTTGNTLETGGFSNLLTTFLDDDVSTTANIGFTFRFGGTNYTTFSVTSNGLMNLGGSALTDYDNVTGNLTGPYLSPYWDDNYTDADGNAQYKVMGAAGSRKLVVDFNLSYLGNTGSADKHFQVWLFESTNKVMFVYGVGNNFNGGFTISILTNGVTDFISVNSSSHTSSKVTANDANNTWPGAGRAYVFTSGGTLPVSLLNFSGYKDGSRNQLQWSTATEINNQGFDIQRSTDGINYSSIGFINSLAVSGNSNSQLNYNFTDNTVMGNKQYYRLRQVDIDNRSKLSSIVVVDGNKPVVVKVEGIYPNPASNLLTIAIASPNKQVMNISLNDITGKTVLKKQLSVDAGNNIVPIDISQLANNYYLLKVTDAAGINHASLKVAVIK